MLRKILVAVTVGVCIYSTTAGADVNDSGVKTQWGYKGNTGPERWGQLNPGFALCSTGREQSPIDIPKKVTNAAYALNINYQSAPLRIMEDGDTTLLIDGTQTIINDGHTLQLNFPAAAKETITYNGKNYQLVQFHFHSPSETEWHHQNFPLEVHFVHQGQNGELLVIAVFAKGGKSNRALQKIVANAPSDTGVEHAIAGQNINPADLLPVKQDYYSYSGSLTTPPCAEGVQWVVMADFITATPAQILTIRRAARGGNARPVQPLDKRQVFYSTA